VATSWHPVIAKQLAPPDQHDRKKADPKQANSCKKDCDTVSGVAEAVCLIPALAAACIIVKPALKTVCPAACEAQHARSSSSRVQLWNASFRSASDGEVPPPRANSGDKPYSKRSSTCRVLSSQKLWFLTRYCQLRLVPFYRGSGIMNASLLFRLISRRRSDSADLVSRHPFCER